ncbi:alanine dehydrogenase [Membranihabitans marinus]|uniref:alanine dehydrogenase n=1 Tax=Membranihabitans marinus TaxID=1227546 RepID=UPI001F4877F3|nr:alanine dehydrogenase [Membranihabitans marinus]
MTFSIKSKWKTQEEKLDVRNRSKTWSIGLPFGAQDENRIGLIPSAVCTLTEQGYRVIVESKAGIKAGYSDKDYINAGAEITQSRKEIYQADIILQCSPPTMEEMELMTQEQIFISPLHVATRSYELIETMKKKKIIGLAMEYLKDKNGTFPIVRILSELAGTAAILQAGQLLSQSDDGPGLLLGGISGVCPPNVVILGGGVVAEYAIRASLGLGLQISVFDNNISKLMRLQNIIGQRLNTSALNYEALQKALLSADVVIGAMHSVNGRTQMIVSEEMVMRMKNGSVIIDISIDQGGCIETSEETNHKEPTFVKHGVIHYCVPNISAKYPKSASIAISNIVSSIFSDANMASNVGQFILHFEGLAHGVYMYKGSITNKYLSSKFGLTYTELELLLNPDI